HLFEGLPGDAGDPDRGVAQRAAGQPGGRHPVRLARSARSGAGVTTLATGTPTGTPTGAPAVGTPPRSPAMALLRAVVRNRLATPGLGVVCLFLLMALFAPLIAPYGADEQDLYAVLAAPSWSHWLGTDNLGRDLLSRLIYGSRVSLFFGLGSTAISAVLGAMIGLIAGYRGGLTDAAIMRVTDAFLCFPPLVFILAVTAA